MEKMDIFKPISTLQLDLDEVKRERTREIGVLRALGWRRWRVLGMILQESVTLTILGGAVGTLAGVLLGLFSNSLPAVQGFMQQLQIRGIVVYQQNPGNLAWIVTAGVQVGVHFFPFFVTEYDPTPKYDLR